MIESHPEGVVLAVWVVPGASRDEIAGIRGGALKVRVSAPAEAGRANRGLLRVLQGVTGASRAEVLSGATARSKRVLLEGCDPAEVARALGVSGSAG